MVVDDDVLEKEDVFILDRIREFITQDEVHQFAAAKVLMTLVERYVRTIFLSLVYWLIFMFSNQQTKELVQSPLILVLVHPRPYNRRPQSD